MIYWIKWQTREILVRFIAAVGTSFSPHVPSASDSRHQRQVLGPDFNRLALFQPSAHLRIQLINRLTAGRPGIILLIPL